MPGRHHIIESGHHFGRLVVLREAARHQRPNGKLVRAFLVRCGCGNEKIVPIEGLVRGQTNSCGCYADEVRERYKTKPTHGMARTLEYQIWASMKDRCVNPNNHSWHRYGGRGISVCQEWITSFEAFYAHIGPKPKECSIDRIDNDGNYEPGNVRWATLKQQSSNTRRTVYVSHNGVTMPLHQVAERLGVKAKSLLNSMARGTPLARTLGVIRVSPRYTSQTL